MKPRSWVLPLALAWPMVSAAGTASPKTDAALTRTLLAADSAILEAYVHRDVVTLQRALADEYVHTNLVGQRETKDQEIAEFSPGGAFSLSAGHIDHGVARRYGEVAVLRADVHWIGATYKPPGQPAIDVSGKYSVTRLYVRRAGRWQLAASHASRQRSA